MKYSIFNDEKIEEFRKLHKLQPYKIKQIYHEIFKNSNIFFQDMSTLSKEMRIELENNFYILPFDIDQTID
jgi:adenine C2-methylase RlmN of 23S rRNA A2503 and tRNA A37